MTIRAAPAEVLRDLPEALWSELVAALRRAVDEVPRHELPARLRPFAGWKPDRLLGSRPRRVIGQVLLEDQRLRELTAAQVMPEAALEGAAGMDAARLVERHGAPASAAVLVVQERWEELATLAARHTAETRVRQAAAAEAAEQRASSSWQADRDRMTAQLAAQRRERDELRRRVDQLEQRVRVVEAAEASASAELADARETIDRLRARLDAETSRSRRRGERDRRLLDEARARARVDGRRVLELAEEAEALAGRLRAAVVQPEQPAEGPAPDDAAGSMGAAGRLPREVAAASAGRPCVLPAGLLPDTAQGVSALLRAPGIQVLVDGYNTTMDPRGKPGAELGDQRRWLLRLSEGICARFRCEVVLVFDGDTDDRPREASRSVRMVFSDPGEIADDRIVDIIAAAPQSQPLLVVTADRELGSRCAEHAADVVSPGAFLTAVRA